jgi:uncharacterized membrane protein HdeD (DUF308 family)
MSDNPTSNPSPNAGDTKRSDRLWMIVGILAACIGFAACAPAAQHPQGAWIAVGLVGAVLIFAGSSLAATALCRYYDIGAPTK